MSPFEQTRCPACDGDDFTVWARSNTPARYVRCRSCGTLYATPRSPKSERQAWIKEAFTMSKDWLDTLETRRPALAMEAAFIGRYLAKGRILDIGCSTGVFFEFFPASNWQYHGVELSPATAEFARQTYRADVRVGILKEVNFPDKYFDLVTLIDTICYLEDPYQDLCEARGLLREDGILAIELPGQAYISHRIRGLLSLFLNRHWTHVDASSSYIFWPSPHSLTLLLERCGFDVIEFRVIPSPTRNSILEFVSRLYFKVMAFLAGRYHPFLTWSPKYICIARVASRAVDVKEKNNPESLVVFQKAFAVHATQVARLHYTHIFPGSQKILEREAIEISLLTAYYSELIRRKDCTVYVAIHTGGVIGYCSLVSNQLKAMLMAVVKNPRIFMRSAGSLRFTNFYQHVRRRLFDEGLGQKWQDIQVRAGVEIRSIAVNEAYRGADIGFRLLVACMQEAHVRKWNSLMAWVAENNTASRRLFERAGFLMVGKKVENSNVVRLYQIRLEYTET
jgi:SAM-dependent methyltransferase/ribosomal protein S18 acetylase RimI-like enzyme